MGGYHCGSGSRFGKNRRLDAGSFRHALHVRMSNTRIFIHLAKQILAVNQLKRAAPQRLKREILSHELAVCALSDDSDYVHFLKFSGIRKAFSDPVASTRTCHYEVLFLKVDHVAVVQIDSKLKCEKISERGIAPQDSEDVF